MVKQHQIDSRENWLNAAVNALRPMFEQRGYRIPEKIRVSVGFPGGGRRPGSYGVQCFVAHNGKDGAYELFVSPTLDDEVKVLGQLTHNLVHVAVGIKSGHRAPFQNCATAMGLEPPWVSTHEGSAFKFGVAKPVIERLGVRYQHTKLSASDPTTVGKKQTTRLRRCECATCGYITYTTAKWLLSSGEPRCPTPGCKNAPMDCDI